MTTPSTQARASRGIKRISCLLGLVFVFVVGLVAVGVTINATQQTPVSKPFVVIGSPQSGTMAEVNRPVRVTASADSQSGITRAELYADGALVAVQETTLPDGSNPLVVSKTWTPPTMGRHVLMARAYTRDNLFADSGIVYVDVVELLTPLAHVDLNSIPRGPNVPLPNLNQISQLSGVPVDRLRDTNPSLRDVDPSVSLPDGTTLDVPRSPAPPPSPGSGESTLPTPVPGGGAPPPPPPVPLPDAPIAPSDLTGAGDCTSVQLTWTDSPNEDNYVVYRIGPGDASLSPIATIPQNSVTYRDLFTLPGVYRYQVAAARGTLEGLSAMFVYTTPGTCVPPVLPPSTTNLMLTWITLDTPTRYDGVFCYVSIDGSPPERTPAYPDNLLPNPASPLTFELNQLPNRGVVPLPDHLDSDPVQFTLECHGWHGFTSTPLGTVSVSHPRAEWDGSERVASADGFRVRYRIGPDTAELRRRTFPPLWGTLPPELLHSLFEFAPTIPAPTSVRFDANGREACDQMPPGFFGFARIVCEISGAPTFTWEWSGDNSRIRGFYFLIDGIPDHPEAGATARAALVSSADWERMQSIGCGGELGFSLDVVGLDGTRQAPANGVIPFPPCPRGPATVDVTFDQLIVSGTSAHGGHIQDNDTCLFCTDRRMELLGDLKAFSGESRDQVDVRAWYGGADVLQPADFGHFFENLSEYLFAKPFVDTGRFFGACIDVTCVSDPGQTFRWAELQLDSTDAPPGTAHNVLSVKVPDGASLTIDIDLEDAPTGFRAVDPLSSNLDPFCVAHIELGRRSRSAWATLDDTRTVTNDYGEAACQLTFHVRGRGP